MLDTASRTAVAVMIVYHGGRSRLLLRRERDGSRWESQGKFVICRVSDNYGQAVSPRPRAVAYCSPTPTDVPFSGILVGNQSRPAGYGPRRGGDLQVDQVAPERHAAGQ
jgi:hypothetical protein